MSRLLLIIPVALFLALAGLFWAGMKRENPGDLPSTFVGQPAPAIVDTVLPGIPGLTPADLQGQVTVVNFWASWCPPCRAEHPTLKELAATPGVKVVGVNMMDQEANVLAFLAEEGNPFAAVAFDPKGRMRLDWGVAAPPETFVLRPDGTVAFRFIGPMVGDDYRQRFLPQLAEVLAE